MNPWSGCGLFQSTEREVTSYLSRKLSGRLAGIDIEWVWFCVGVVVH